MLYIIFCGNDHIGKTTMANSLFKIIINGFRKIPQLISYADGVREELVNYYGLPNDIVFNKKINKNNIIIRLGDYQYDDSIPLLWKKYNLINDIDDYNKLEISLRDVFVNHGTKIRRKQDDLYWAKKLEINKHSNILIIDDARSPSDFIIDKNPFIFHLYNDSLISDINEEQSRMNIWLNNNTDKITEKINVPIPLTNFDADCINKTKILPYIRNIFLT